MLLREAKELLKKNGYRVIKEGTGWTPRSDAPYETNFSLDDVSPILTGRNDDLQKLKRRIYKSNKNRQIGQKGYEDVTATQMSGMKERLTKYIETKSEFKIKSKSNPPGLVVTVEKEGDGLALFNANTGVELAYTKDIDQMIKAIFDIQKHLEAYQKEESIILDMPREINDGFKKYEYVIIPDTEPFNSGKPKDQPYCHMATVYLHGQAEDDAGFDITFIIPKDGNEKVKLGKTKVGIITLQGLREGIMYTWVDPMFNKHTKGLIVYPEDTKAKAYAEKTFANPPLNI